jgi:hypothetical protein
MIRNKLEVLRWGVVSSKPNTQARGPPPVGYLGLLIQYICSYPPYVEAVSSIRNLSMRHAVVSGDLRRKQTTVCNSVRKKNAKKQTKVGKFKIERKK